METIKNLIKMDMKWKCLWDNIAPKMLMDFI